MKGEKKLLAKIKGSNDLGWLRATALDIHRASDVAAFGNHTREWNKLWEIEASCRKRIAEIESKEKEANNG